MHCRPSGRTEQNYLDPVHGLGFEHLPSEIEVDDTGVFYVPYKLEKGQNKGLEGVETLLTLGCVCAARCQDRGPPSLEARADSSDPDGQPKKALVCYRCG